MVCTKEGLVVWLVRAALSVGGQARGLLRALGCKCARTLPRGGSVYACGSVLADACFFFCGGLDTHALPRSVPSAPACGCVRAWRVSSYAGFLSSSFMTAITHCYPVAFPGFRRVVSSGYGLCWFRCHYDIRRVPAAAALFVLWFAAAVRADLVASRKAEPNATLWPDVCLWERLHFYCTVCAGDTCSGSSVLRIATAAAKRASLFPPVLLMRVVFAVWLVRCFCRLSSLIHTGMAARGCCLLRCCHSSCGRRVFRSCGCVVF